MEAAKLSSYGTGLSQLRQRCEGGHHVSVPVEQARYCRLAQFVDAVIHKLRMYRVKTGKGVAKALTQSLSHWVSWPWKLLQLRHLLDIN